MGSFFKCFSPSLSRNASSTRLSVQSAHPDAGTPAASGSPAVDLSMGQPFQGLRAPRLAARPASLRPEQREETHTKAVVNEMMFNYYAGTEAVRSPFARQLRDNVKWWYDTSTDARYEGSARSQAWRGITDTAPIDRSGIDSIKTFSRLLRAFRHHCQQMNSAAQPALRSRIRFVLDAMCVDGVLRQRCLQMSTTASVSDGAGLDRMLGELEQAVIRGQAA